MNESDGKCMGSAARAYASHRARTTTSATSRFGESPGVQLEPTLNSLNQGACFKRRGGHDRKFEPPPPAMETRHPDFVVGIGGSAGGLNAYKALLAAMPPDTGMAFVIVSHIFPSANSLLADILSRHTKMPVMVVATGMPILANHVYVLPANADLLVEGDAFKVVSPRSRGNVQIDVFFTSLAEAMGPRAIGIILSGFDGDGTAGCKHIKAKGGKTFAQDASAEVAEMPLHAEAAGCIDFVLPPDKMPAALRKLATASENKRRQSPG